MNQVDESVETGTGTVIKPWGKEEIHILTDKYCLKTLFINKGHRLSLQYHKVKTETLWVVTGLVDIALSKTKGWPEGGTWTFSPGHYVTIEPGTIHRITALEDSAVLEVSTPETWDVVRLSDDYSRLGSPN